MNFLPSFVAWPFAVAGAVAAAGPIIIHLLNRRRYRTVHWAAMDFLREALQRNRRILQMRDILLLILRTIAVLLVGLALARPFFSGGNERFDGTEPLHAVLVIDNSLSMGYETLEGTLLDRAKARARRFIDRLPADSRVTVVPLCGSTFGFSPDAATKESSILSLDRLEIVDRSADVTRAISEGVRACESGPSLARRLVFFSDQQARNWRDASPALHAPKTKDLPPIQFVDVSADQPENTWISDLRVQDGLADVETPTTLIVQLRYQGAETRRDVEVRLSVDDVGVASKVVTLEPGQGAREVSFQYLFDTHPVEPGTSTAVPVKVSIAPDNLPEDDERFLTVPVVAGLPVVFVDQYGADQENPVRRRVGETRPLRRLLAPVASRSAETRQLVRVRHIRLDQVTRDVLEDARLVVIAGIADPSGSVPLLRQYVEQGGQLVIAAGGEYDPAGNAGFDASRWTAAAWLDGAGILPAPLLPDPIGATPQEASRSELTAFFLSFDSLYAHQYFQLAGISEQQMRDLYAEPLFFKAVRIDESEQAMGQLHQTELLRLRGKYNIGTDSKSTAGQAVTVDNASDDRPRPGLDGDSRWLLWQSPASGSDDQSLPEDATQRDRALKELAAQTQPRTLARFDDPAETPYLVTRKIGRGDVLFASSGLLAEWNTLPTTNAILLFDRILRQMILSTLPRRNFEPGERIVLPLPSSERDITVTLHRPGQPDQREVLDTGFIGRSQYGFSVDQPLGRGIYQVAAYRQDSTGDPAAEPAVWTMPLAINGAAEESELLSFSREQFDDQMADTGASWVGPAEEISLAGTQIRGQNSWWWLIVAVLGLLILELALLAGISPKLERAGTLS